MLHDSESENSHATWFSSVATSFPALSSINPPRYTSFSFTWELGASSSLEFLLILLSGFSAAMSIPGHLDAIRPFADEELSGTWEDKFIAVGLDFAATLSSSFCSCILFAIFLRQLIKLEFLAQQREPETADVEQTKEMVPLITCEITFGQNVCELMFGINVSNLNLRIKNNPVKKPIQSNSVGSWHVCHCGTSAFDYHFFTASLSSKHTT